MRNKENLALALDEDLIAGPHIVAARRGTSVTKLVRRSLEALVCGDQEPSRAKARLKALIRNPKMKVGSAGWTRNEIRERS